MPVGTRPCMTSNTALTVGRVSLAKKVSTALSQEHEVGVKWNDPARMAGEPLAHLGLLVGAVVVEHDVDQLAGRHRPLDRIEEADELLVPVALHAAGR